MPHGPEDTVRTDMVVVFSLLAACGYAVASVLQQDYAKIRASRGAPGFDVAGLLTPPEVILGVKEGLLEKLTEREVPNLRHLWGKT